MSWINLPQSTIQGIPGEIIASLIVFFLLFLFCLVVYVKAKKADPLKKPKGILLLAELFVQFIDSFVKENMGKRFVKLFAPYVGLIGAYIFLSFVISLLGLPSPFTYFIVPFCCALITFCLIHAVSIYYTRWKYFKRYTAPFVVFLPINLISMWAPLLSLSLRLFGNAMAGWVLMNLIYGVFDLINSALFAGLPIPLAALITPALHAYFDVFSGFIQTAVFVFLTMLFIGAEAPEEEEIVKAKETLHLS